MLFFIFFSITLF